MPADSVQFWFIDIPLSVYIAIISGYLAYRVAYSGISESHKVFDIMLISIIFSSVATLTIFMFNELKIVHNIFSSDSLKLASAFSFTILFGLFWRKIGIYNWRKFLEYLNVYKEDGSIVAWNVLTKQNKEFVQAKVTLKNGTVLSLLDRIILDNVPFKGLYLDDEGGIFLVVQEMQLQDGTIVKIQNASDKIWGTSFTYVPASEINSVSFRLR